MHVISPKDKSGSRCLREAHFWKQFDAILLKRSVYISTSVLAKKKRGKNNEHNVVVYAREEGSLGDTQFLVWCFFFLSSWGWMDKQTNKTSGDQLLSYHIKLTSKQRFRPLGLLLLTTSKETHIVSSVSAFSFISLIETDWWIVKGLFLDIFLYQKIICIQLFLLLIMMMMMVMLSDGHTLCSLYYVRSTSPKVSKHKDGWNPVLWWLSRLCWLCWSCCLPTRSFLCVVVGGQLFGGVEVLI